MPIETAMRVHADTHPVIVSPLVKLVIQTNNTVFINRQKLQYIYNNAQVTKIADVHATSTCPSLV